MITHLTIRNITLFEKLDLEIPKNFITITGETGAGKSLILDSLAFVTGKKIPNLLRHGTESGYVAINFENIPHEVKNILIDSEINLEEENLILKRTINSDGKTKCFINNEQVNYSLYKKIGENLLEIHGQNDQRFLSEKNTQLKMLDLYGTPIQELQKLSDYYVKYKEIYQEYVEKKEFIERSMREKDYLNFMINELENLSPEIGEEENLANKRVNLLSKGKIISTIKSALNELEKSGLSSSINSATRTLIRANLPEIDFTNIIKSLDNASNELGEASFGLEKILLGFEEEENLDQIEERLFSLRAAARKYNTTPDGLSEIFIKAKEDFNLLDNSENEIKKIEIKIKEFKENYLKQAKIISGLRKKSAAQLTSEILSILTELKMEKVRLEIHFFEEDNENITSQGIDKIEFLISANPGVPLAPLSDIASGGELSRIMLAFKSAMSQIKSGSSIIFDEIDTGISGSTADAVGKKLKKIEGQIIVVTHLPQVASKASHHLLVQKKIENNQTIITLNWLNRAEKEEEIARMIAGENITENAMMAAKELLNAANS